MQPEVMTGGEAENEGIDEVELTFILATTAYVSLSQSRSAEKRLKIKRGLLCRMYLLSNNILNSD